MSDSVARFKLLGTSIGAINAVDATDLLRSWIANGDRGRSVNFTNVHMLVEGAINPTYRTILRNTDLNCADGMPVVWAGSIRSRRALSQVCGPEFMPHFCAATVDLKLRHFFYGGQESSINKMAYAIQELVPGIHIAGSYSPPFRELTSEEDLAVVDLINETQPDIIWVGLGCPKQEIWIHDHRELLNASVLLAVGQAFDILAGTKKRAPKVVRRVGLEWLYRLCHEPRRLARRYLVYNSIFVYRLLMESLHRDLR